MRVVLQDDYYSKCIYADVTFESEKEVEEFIECLKRFSDVSIIDQRIFK